MLKLAKLLGLKSAKDDGEGTLTGELGQAMILMVQTAMKVGGAAFFSLNVLLISLSIQSLT